MRYSMFMLMLLMLPTAHALETIETPGAWQLAQVQQNRLSLSEAADLVQRQRGGRVLAAQAVREQGREMYRIKILTAQGEVRIVLVDAATGNME